jgi:hypothetical protein
MSAHVSSKPPPLSIVVRVGVYDSHILHTPSVWVHQHSMLKPNNPFFSIKSMHLEMLLTPCGWHKSPPLLTPILKLPPLIPNA